MPRRVSILLLMAFWPALAMAQSQETTVSLPTRDASALVGWLTHRPPPAGVGADDWNHRWYGGAQAGYYWTEHLKTELEVGLTNEGSTFVAVQAPRPNPPLVRFERRFYRDVKLSLGQSWQFFRNQWVHPFIGGGVDLDRERLRREVEAFGDTPPQFSVTEERHWRAKAFAAAGAKLYFTAKGFVRLDAHVASGRSGQHLVFRVGVGGDF